MIGCTNSATTDSDLSASVVARATTHADKSELGE
jgi:hypothetical protein